MTPDVKRLIDFYKSPLGKISRALVREEIVRFAGNVRGLPVGMSFFGRAWSEPTLIKFAYAYEQATKHRKPPTFAATTDLKESPGAPRPQTKN